MSPADFEQRLSELRPRLHRYCARMTGSVIDGEDVVQEALVKALEAFGAAGPIADVEAWLVRIAHNTALDFLRRRARQNASQSDEDLEMIVDPTAVATDSHVAEVSLRTLLRLPVSQRSSVILMDVLGYSLEEINAITGSSIAAVKAALHRGRARLRELANEPDDTPLPVLGEPERSLLADYVARFNARDFDAIRDRLAAEVRLEVVGRVQARGRERVGNYFSNYSHATDWHMTPGLVEGHPAVLVRDPADPSGRTAYFVLLQWTAGEVAGIRDFRYARYAAEGAELVPLPR